MRTLPRRIVAACVSLSSLAAAGCATAARTPWGPDDLGLRVVVENHGWDDLSVYASSGGGRQRLGNVGSGRSATFRIQTLNSRSTDLELMATPMASSNHLSTGRLFVSEGQRVVWTIHQGHLGGDVTIR